MFNSLKKFITKVFHLPPEEKNIDFKKENNEKKTLIKKNSSVKEKSVVPKIKQIKDKTKN